MSIKTVELKGATGDMMLRLVSIRYGDKDRNPFMETVRPPNHIQPDFGIVNILICLTSLDICYNVSGKPCVPCQKKNSVR